MATTFPFQYYEVVKFTKQNRITPFENIVGKGENAGNQHFLLFPHVLYTCCKLFEAYILSFAFLFRSTFTCLLSSANWSQFGEVYIFFSYSKKVKWNTEDYSKNSDVTVQSYFYIGWRYYLI